MKILITFLAAIFISSFASGSSKQISAWKVVPNEEVCMVTNMHFARPQIPVVKDGRTYYGCCENCKDTIKNNSESRAALDPYSKKSVDKAKAVIAADKSGLVLYFENKTNFNKYVAMSSSKSKF